MLLLGPWLFLNVSIFYFIIGIVLKLQDTKEFWVFLPRTTVPKAVILTALQICNE